MATLTKDIVFHTGSQSIRIRKALLEQCLLAIDEHHVELSEQINMLTLKPQELDAEKISRLIFLLADASHDGINGLGLLSVGSSNSSGHLSGGTDVDADSQSVHAWEVLSSALRFANNLSAIGIKIRLEEPL